MSLAYVCLLALFMIFLGQALRYDTIHTYIEKAFSFLQLFLLMSCPCGSEYTGVRIPYLARIREET